MTALEAISLAYAAHMVVHVGMVVALARVLWRRLRKH